MLIKNTGPIAINMQRIIGTGKIIVLSMSGCLINGLTAEPGRRGEEMIECALWAGPFSRGLYFFQARQDRSPITDHRLPITDYRLQITDYLRVHNFPPPQRLNLTNSIPRPHVGVRDGLAGGDTNAATDRRLSKVWRLNGRSQSRQQVDERNR